MGSTTAKDSSITSIASATAAIAPTKPVKFSSSSTSSIDTAKLLTPIIAEGDGRKHYKKDPSQRISVWLRSGLYTCKLIQIGYPEDSKQLTYDPNFPDRGLWLNSHYGNLLKVDGFGNILIGVHGTQSMITVIFFHQELLHDIEECFPNKFIKLVANVSFLLTTSEYKYIHGVMTYLAGRDWPQLFDIAIQVDTTNGTLKVGMHAGQLNRGNEYAGGSCDGF
uniref:Uncharacterized protein n=1 Tax=Panagrolaimus sp. ES5 TaxID=591445 RepID=A0AC34FUW2_9BILA